MYATIQKWGNSNGLRFPKALLDAIGLKENDRVELIQSADAITIKKRVPRSTRPWKSARPRFTESQSSRSTAFRLRKWIGARQRAVRHGNCV